MLLEWSAQIVAPLEPVVTLMALVGPASTSDVVSDAIGIAAGVSEGSSDASGVGIGKNPNIRIVAIKMRKS